jgi:DNA repair exonuclease SbcCD ATPase subunit
MENSNELMEKIKELEGIIKDVEEKNKRLVELLNANIYNKAEQYKERVLSKLQERNPSVGPVSETPNKFFNLP